jgi:hypothetical protein
MRSYSTGFELWRIWCEAKAVLIALTQRFKVLAIQLQYLQSRKRRLHIRQCQPTSQHSLRLGYYASAMAGTKDSNHMALNGAPFSILLLPKSPLVDWKTLRRTLLLDFLSILTLGYNWKIFSPNYRLAHNVMNSRIRI